MADRCELVTCQRLSMPHHVDTHLAGKGDSMDCVRAVPTAGRCWQCGSAFVLAPKGEIKPDA